MTEFVRRPSTGSLTERAKTLGVSAAIPSSAIEALSTLASLVRDISANRTERARVEAWHAVEVKRIEAASAALSDYLDRVFAERRTVHTKLFAAMDAAMESGDVTALQTVVGGIVEYAKTSPLVNVAELQRVWRDPDAVIEL